MPRGRKKKEAPKIDDHVAFLTDIRKYFEDTAARMAEAKQIAERVQEITTDFLTAVAPAGEVETDGDGDEEVDEKPVKTRKAKGAWEKKPATKTPRGEAKPCCGSKGPRHKADCEGKLPAEERRSTEQQDVVCVDCDWKGKIGADADVMEAKCPKCRGSLITK